MMLEFVCFFVCFFFWGGGGWTIPLMLVNVLISCEINLLVQLLEGLVFAVTSSTVCTDPFFNCRAIGATHSQKQHKVGQTSAPFTLILPFSNVICLISFLSCGSPRWVCLAKCYDLVFLSQKFIRLLCFFQHSWVFDSSIFHRRKLWCIRRWPL